MTTNYSETSNDPDVIREEIEQTRRNLSRDVNALGESVTPSHLATAAGRQGQGQGQRPQGPDHGQRLGCRELHGRPRVRAASEVGDKTQDAAAAVKDRAVGNPWRPGSSPWVRGGCWARCCRLAEGAAS